MIDLERKLWNFLANAFMLLAPYPFSFCANKPALRNWYIKWHDEKNLEYATKIIYTIGLGKIHKKRIQKLSDEIFK